MIRIAPKGSPERDRMIKEHRACIDSMKGGPGCTILRCKTPGETTDVSGGIHEDFELNRVLFNWGETMIAPSVVPEPGTVSLAAIAGLLMLCGRSGRR